MLKSQPAYGGGGEGPGREERCAVSVPSGCSAQGLQFGGDLSERGRIWGPAPQIRVPVAAPGWVGEGRRGRRPRDVCSMLPASCPLSYGKAKMMCALYLQHNITLPCKEDAQFE